MLKFHKINRFDIKHITEDSELQPCLVAFDLVYLNGKSLTQLPQLERFNLLKANIKPLEGRLMIAEHKIQSTNEQVCYKLLSCNHKLFVKDNTVI